MTKTSNLTPQQKEKNQQYILANLDKYIIDSRGNFVHIDSILLLDSEYCFIYKEAVSNSEEIVRTIEKMILQNREDWEVVLDETGYFIKNQRDGRIIYETGFGFSNNSEEGFISRGYDIIGELGYRKSIWKDYKKNKKWREEWLKNKREWQEQASQNSDSASNSTNQNDDKEENNIQFAPPKTEPKRQEKKNQNPPSPSEVQNSYNSDKDKSKINNNPTPTTPEQKEQANQLLKLIITAELLVKEQKFNPETLSQLIKENNNTPSYQLLNKERRIDKVVNELKSMEKSRKNNNSSVERDKNKWDNKIPTGIIIGSVCLVMVILGVVTMSLISKKIIKKRKSN